jgi:hypothetical protein
MSAFGSTTLFASFSGFLAIKSGKWGYRAIIFELWVLVLAILQRHTPFRVVGTLKKNGGERMAQFGFRRT